MTGVKASRPTVKVGRPLALAVGTTFVLLLITVQFQAGSHARNALLKMDEERPDVLAGVPSVRRPTTNIRQHQDYKTVDILSIGSQERPELLVAQQESFASHISVRNFYNATEADDSDPDCHKYLTPHDAYNISVFCKHRRDDLHPLRYYMQNLFANVPWLKAKSNPVGWMCAQRRPLHGLYKVLSDYSHRIATEHNKDGAADVLPDFLILLDDIPILTLKNFSSY